MIKNKKTIEEKNIDYFQAMKDSRASLNQLRIALIVIWIPAVFSYALSQYQNIRSNPEAYMMFKVSNTLLICFLMIGIFSLLKKFVFRFQIISSVMLVILVFVITVFVDGVAFLISTEDGNIILSEPFLSRSYARIIFYLIPIIFVLSILINIFLLRHRLKVGFSEIRTNKNFLAISGTYSSKTLGIIFAAVVIVPNILTQGRYFMNIFGIICVLGFSAIFSNPIVEFSYLAYLKTKDKKFWEEQPYNEKGKVRGKVIGISEKKKLRNRLIIGLYVILSVLFFYFIGDIYGNQIYPIIIRIIGLLILISYLILIIVWIITKMKKRKKG